MVSLILDLSTLPPFYTPHAQMHTLDRFSRHRTGNPDLLIWVLHLELKPAHDPRNSTPQLSARKVLADTRPLAVQEGYLREVRRRATIAVARLVALLVRVDPALGHVLVAGLAPEFRTAVDSVGAENDPRACGDALPGHSGITDGLANGGRHRGVEPKDLLADAVEEWHGFQVVEGDGMVGRGDDRADFFPQTGLHVGVLAKLIAAPCQSTGGGFVLHEGSAGEIIRSYTRVQLTPAAKNVNI